MTSQQYVVSALVGASPDLLDDAARHAAARRASVVSRDLPTPGPAPEQEPQQPALAFSATVNAVLAQPAALREPILVEALKLLADAGQVLPPRMLVALLEAARVSQDVAAALPPALGARGCWLASLDDDWLRGRVIVAPAPDDWDEGTPAQRVAWLRRLRGIDPAAGRALVVGAGKERASDRVQFVSALETGLGLDDEEFLVSCLTGRSKEVSRAAADLLARLDGSAYLERVVGLARDCFSRAGDSGSVVAVAPTEGALKAMNLTSEVGSAAQGPQARVLRLLGAVPPHRWADAGLDVAAVYPEVMLDDEPVATGGALEAAVLRWGDVDAARVLHPLTRSLSLALLLPSTERDAALEASIQAAVGDHRVFHALCDALAQRREGIGGHLGPGAVEALFVGVEAAAEAGKPIPEPAFRLLGFATNPAAASTIASRLARVVGTAASSGAQERYLRDATAALTLRQSIYESITKEPR